MRIKCRGYSGKLLALEANEKTVQTLNRGVMFDDTWYEIEMRADDGAKICLYGVQEEEIHIEQSADD